MKYTLGYNRKAITPWWNEKLLGKGVIVKSKPEFADYISGVFTRHNKDNTKRIILNLNNFDQNVKLRHFIMEPIQNLLNMMRGVFMGSIDFKDAFFPVPIYEDHKNVLKVFLSKITINLSVC